MSYKLVAEQAKSGKATCGRCNTPIEKGNVRVQGILLPLFLFLLIFFSHSLSLSSPQTLPSIPIFVPHLSSLPLSFHTPFLFSPPSPPHLLSSLPLSPLSLLSPSSLLPLSSLPLSLSPPLPLSPSPLLPFSPSPLLPSLLEVDATFRSLYLQGEVSLSLPLPLSPSLSLPLFPSLSLPLFASLWLSSPLPNPPS